MSTSPADVFIAVTQRRREREAAQAAANATVSSEELERLALVEAQLNRIEKAEDKRTSEPT